MAIDKQKARHDRAPTFVCASCGITRTTLDLTAAGEPVVHLESTSDTVICTDCGHPVPRD